MPKLPSHREETCLPVLSPLETRDPAFSEVLTPTRGNAQILLTLQILVFTVRNTRFNIQFCFLPTEPINVFGMDLKRQQFFPDTAVTGGYL